MMMDKKQIKREVLDLMKKKYTDDGMPESYYDWKNTDEKIVSETIDEVLNRV